MPMTSGTLSILSREQPTPATAGKKPRYRLLIVSPIPICRTGDQCTTLDLWVRDLEAQIKPVQSLCIVAPGGFRPATNSRRIPGTAKTVLWDHVFAAAQADALA